MSIAPFLGGLAKGYVDQSRYQDQKDRLKQEMDMRLADADFRQKQNQRTLDQQQDISLAAAPATVDVGAGGMTKPTTADNMDVGQPGEPGADAGGLQPGAMVNGRSVPNADVALSQAATYNTPGAMRDRQAAVLEKYQPGAGIGLQQAALGLQKGQFGFNKDQTEYARTLQNENAVDTSRALVGGDPEEIKKAFNKSGDWKIVGDPMVKKRDRDDIPGIDSLPTNDVTVTLKGPDGQTMTKTVNSYDFATHLMPYADVLGMNIKGTSAENTADYHEQIGTARTAAAQAQIELAEAKAKALRDNPGSATREDRLRWTSIFTDAGRQAVEAQKTINQLQRDPLFMRSVRKDPNGAEAQQLAGAQAAFAQHQKDRETFRSLLAGSTGGSMPAPALGAAPALGSAPVTVKTQADRDALPAGTLYIAPDGSKRIKQ